MKFSLVASVASLILACSVKARVSFPPGLTWDYLLSENHLDLKKEKAEVIVLDVHSTRKEDIERYHKAGKKVICYFSGGTYEHFRADEKKLKKVHGLVSKEDELDDWDGEYYLDVRKSGIKPIMEERIKLAKEKNCDGIEADNLDVCKNEDHIHLDDNDCITYAKWLAKTAHKYDISIGLKNSRYMADKVADDFDFAINESCFTHGKYCANYKELFLNKGKAVFSIQYNNYLKHEGGIDALCKHINGYPISMIVKEKKLIQGGWTLDSKTCGKHFDNGVRNISKKATIKKTTTVKKVNPVAKKTNNPVKPVNPVNPVTAKTLPVKTVAKSAPVFTPVNTPVPKTTQVSKITTTTTVVAKATVDPIVTEIDGSVNEKDDGNGIGAGVAVTGSIVGAAAAFIFAKKNPKQYENLKRSLSEKATTVKRGASTLSRKASQRATTLTRKMSKRSNPDTIIPQTNDNYRYKFTQQFDC